MWRCRSRSRLDERTRLYFFIYFISRSVIQLEASLPLLKVYGSVKLDPVHSRRILTGSTTL